MYQIPMPIANARSAGGWVGAEKSRLPYGTRGNSGRMRRAQYLPPSNGAVDIPEGAARRPTHHHPSLEYLRRQLADAQRKRKPTIHRGEKMGFVIWNMGYRLFLDGAARPPHWPEEGATYGDVGRGLFKFIA